MQAILLGESVILLLVVLTCVHLLQRIFRLEQLVSGTAPGAFGPSSAVDLEQLLPPDLMSRSKVLFLSATCLSCHEIAASLPAATPGMLDLVVYEDGLGATAVASMRAGGWRLSAVPPGALSAAGVRLMPQLISVRNGRVVDALIGMDINSEISRAVSDRIGTNPSEVTR